jgi:hypothetical protein
MARGKARPEEKKPEAEAARKAEGKEAAMTEDDLTPFQRRAMGVVKTKPAEEEADPRKMIVEHASAPTADGPDANLRFSSNEDEFGSPPSSVSIGNIEVIFDDPGALIKGGVYSQHAAHIVSSVPGFKLIQPKGGR